MMHLFCFLSFTVLMGMKGTVGALEKGEECKDLKKWCPNYSCTYKVVKKYCKKKCGTCPTPPPLPETIMACGKMKINTPPFTPNRKDTLKGTFPWQAALFFENEFFCGGSLVSKKHVLTSANCIAAINADAKNLKVVLGDRDLRSAEGTEQSIDVKKIIRQDSYEHHKKDDDIVILELTDYVNVTEDVSPICLPFKDEELKPDSKCVITGWGREYPQTKFSDKLKYANVPFVDNMSCSKRNDMSTAKVTDKMICTGFDDGIHNVSSCHGDNGGPVACKNGQLWMVHGVISWGSNVCDGFEMFTVSTKVSAYRSWIDKEMALFPTK